MLAKDGEFKETKFEVVGVIGEDVEVVEWVFVGT